MPCTLTGSLEGDAAVFSKEKITELTQLLCGACRLLEENEIDMSKVKAVVYSYGACQERTTKLTTWWKSHKKLDAKREEK